MDEVLGYLKLYKEAFPENPAFAGEKSKKKKQSASAGAAAEEKPVSSPVAAEQPTVDVNKAVEDALNLVADTVIFGTLNQDLGVELAGSTQNINDAIGHVLNAFTGLTEGLGTWSQAKGNFVDTFSRLVFKSSTQVGSGTSKSYSDLHTFVTTFSSSEGQTLLAGERPQPSPAREQEAAEEQYQEEEKVGSTEEVASPGEQKEGETADTGLLGEEKPERGAYRGRGRGGRGRGGYFKKHNEDDEGFKVVKEGGEAHKEHYNSRRHQYATRGGFRGGRGRGGEHQAGEYQGERRGGYRGGEGRGEYRGRGRGGQGGDRPWTEHKPREHRGRGEVRNAEFAQPTGEEKPTSVPATEPAQQQ